MSDSTTPPQPGSPRLPLDPTGTSAPPPPPPGYVPAVYVQHPTSARAATKFVLYILVVALLVSITMNVYLFGPVRTIANALAGGMQEQPYNQPFEPTNNKDRIVIVEISGTIDAATAEFARQAFYKLEQDPPAAVILRVESGGGGVTASDQIWHAIKQFRETHKDIPVIASFGVAAASGGYYISAPTDYIFAERTTMTGSIGVYAQLPAAGGLIEKMGVEMNMVIADKSPDKDDANNLFVEWYDQEGELTPEGEQAIAVLKNLVNRSYETFLEVVLEGRMAANSKITKAQLESAATGAIFIGKEALDAKLVDKIGYLDDAIDYAAKQANISDDPTLHVLRESESPLLSLGLMDRQPDGVNLSDVTGDELRTLVDDATAVKLEYRMRIR